MRETMAGPGQLFLKRPIELIGRIEIGIFFLTDYILLRYEYSNILHFQSFKTAF